MSNKIEEIKTALKSGAKATKYRVKLSFPTEVQHKMELQSLNSSHRDISYAVFCLKKKIVFTNYRLKKANTNNSANTIDCKKPVKKKNNKVFGQLFNWPFRKQIV